MAQRPFAVFDIDGTLLRWQLYHAVADELVKTGQLDEKEFKKVRDARMTWKKRTHSDSYIEYENILINYFENAIANINQDNLDNAFKTVINAYKDQVYTYTRDLIINLKQKGYLIFAISASQHEIVRMLADYYEFDDAIGSKYETSKGVYTGETDIMKNQRKPQALNELVAKYNATWKNSIGVGDSESDIAMLEKVERPIAFNPTKKLFKTAKNNGWEVVIERKNMIYSLEPKNGQFILK